MILTTPSPVPLISPWIAAPVAGAIILGLVWHLAALSHRERIPIRRRLRQINAGVMIATTLAAAYGLAGVAPAEGTTYVLTWSLVFALAGCIVILAIVDVFVTLRLRRLAEAELRRRLRAPAGQSRETSPRD